MLHTLIFFFPLLAEKKTWTWEKRTAQWRIRYARCGHTGHDVTACIQSRSSGERTQREAEALSWVSIYSRLARGKTRSDRAVCAPLPSRTSHFICDPLTFPRGWRRTCNSLKEHSPGFQTWQLKGEPLYFRFIQEKLIVLFFSHDGFQNQIPCKNHTHEIKSIRALQKVRILLRIPPTPSKEKKRTFWKT